MYVLKRKSSWLERSFLIMGFLGIVVLIYIVVFSPEISAQSVGQVHLQQESVMQFYEETFQEEPSTIIHSGTDTVTVKGESIDVEKMRQLVIISSASDAVNVSTTVLDNLSLSVIKEQPQFATNWQYGATLHTDWKSDTEVYYTVTADY
jgi:hypothetical protein